MRVQFINGLLGGDFSAMDIGITQLATVLNNTGRHQSAILDLTFHTKHWQEYLGQEIRKFKPDVIAMSTNTMYMQYVKRIAREIKEKFGLPIIVGGYHASIHPKDTTSLQDIDYVFVGDAENTLVQFLDNMEKGASNSKIGGLWYQDKAGRIHSNNQGCFIRDLDSWPTPDWDMWKDLDKYFYYLGMLYMIGTRGCPYKCTYCDAVGISKAVKGPYFRFRDPASYAKEMAFLWDKYEKRGMRLAQVFDEVFTFSTKWVKDFSKAYKEYTDVDKHGYSTFARIDNLDKERLEIMGKSGCKLLRVGIEAGNSHIRQDIYKKKISTNQIKKTFKLAKANGIDFTAFYILGGPGETKKTINDTIRLARKLNAARSAFFVFKPFTQQSVQQIIQYGGFVDEKKWAKADNITFDAVVRLKDVAPWQVEYYQKKAYFLTFGKRWLKMVGEEKHRYFTRLGTYMYRGVRDGLDPKYLLPYYHIYGYNWVDK